MEIKIGDRVRRMVNHDSFLSFALRSKIVFIPPKDYIFTVEDIEETQLSIGNWFFGVTDANPRPGWAISYFDKVSE